MNHSPASGDDADSVFQQLLVSHLEAVQRGETVDRDQLFREHPRYAQSICDFLDNQQLVQAAFGGFRPPDASPGLHPDALETLTGGERPGNASSSEWSFARLTKASFPIAFGEYSLLGEIDRGGMGIVFKAEHQRLKRTVALKIMRSGALASDEELRRFRGEAEASAALNHPHIIPIFEIGEAHGLIYFTMAYVAGQDLAAVVRQRALAPKEAARLMVRVTDAVATAHRHGIIHRDLKPSNILIGQDGEPFVIDFGLAKQKRTDEALTGTGQILGTPAYMAPEQARGERLSAATDVYSLGAVLYQLVTRQPPFSGPAPFDILLQVLHRDPALPRKINKKLPRELQVIITRAMSKAPEDRYASAEQLQEDLQRFLIDEPITRPQRSWDERLVHWWRREPVLVSHLGAIGAVLLIVVAAAASGQVASSHIGLKIGLLCAWVFASFGIQQLSRRDRWQESAHWLWAACDVTIYTTLIYLADPPRGLLLIGYPMMMVASGLFYRMRFVVFVTGLCMLGFATLWGLVVDPFTTRPDFGVMYLSGLVILGFCLLSMIRRIRGLSEYFEGGKS